MQDFWSLAVPIQPASIPLLVRLFNYSSNKALSFARRGSGRGSVAALRLTLTTIVVLRRASLLLAVVTTRLLTVGSIVVADIVALIVLWLLWLLCIVIVRVILRLTAVRNPACAVERFATCLAPATSGYASAIGLDRPAHD